MFPFLLGFMDRFRESIGNLVLYNKSALSRCAIEHQHRKGTSMKIRIYVKFEATITSVTCSAILQVLRKELGLSMRAVDDIANCDLIIIPRLEEVSERWYRLLDGSSKPILIFNADRLNMHEFNRLTSCLGKHLHRVHCCSGKRNELVQGVKDFLDFNSNWQSGSDTFVCSLPSLGR